jgi:hypothetical protein
MTGGGAGSSGGDDAERSRRAEGGGSTESGGRVEGFLGSTEGGMGAGGSGRRAAIARNGAFRPQTHYPGTCRYCADDIGFVYSVKGEEEGDKGGTVWILVHLGVLFFGYC